MPRSLSTNRRHRSALAIRKLLSRFHSSTVSRAEFVQTEGLCLSTLRRYLNTHRTRTPRTPQSTKLPTFLELESPTLPPVASQAHFPAPKTMAGWIWNWPTKINRMQIENLLRLHFLEDRSNVILLGTAGLGKTHLACELGNAACLQKHAVLFASTIDVVNRLSAAQSTPRSPVR